MPIVKTFAEQCVQKTFSELFKVDLLLLLTMSRMSEDSERAPCRTMQKASLDCLTSLERVRNPANSDAACTEEIALYKACLRYQMEEKTKARNDAFFGRDQNSKR